MADPFASEDLIARITRAKRVDAQIRALEEMGYNYLPDRTGRPLVPVVDIEKRLGEKLIYPKHRN